MRLPFSIPAALLTTHLFRAPHTVTSQQSVKTLEEYPESTLDATAWALIVSKKAVSKPVLC